MLKNLKASLFMAFHAVQRGNKKTGLFTIMMMIVLVVNLLLLPSLMDEMDSITKSQMIYKYMAHVVIKPADGKQVIDDVDALKERLYAFPEVVGVSAQFLVPVVVHFKDNNRPCTIYFIDPEEEDITTHKSDDMIYGEFLGRHDTGGVVLGAEAAGVEEAVFKDLSLGGVNVGNKINISFPNGLSKSYAVEGIYQTKLVEADWNIMMTMDDLESLYGIKNQATQVIVRLNKDEIEDKFINKAYQMGFNEDFSITKEMQGLVLTNTLEIVKSIVIAVSLFVSMLTLFIVIYINVLNKRKIIAIIRSIGIKRSAIILSFIIQSLFYTFIGIIIGVLAMYFVFVPYFQAHPLDLPFAFVTLKLKARTIIINMTYLVFTSIIAGFLPVYQIAKENIVNILRN